MAESGSGSSSSSSAISMTFRVFAAPLDIAMRTALRVSMNITDDDTLLPLSTFEAALANIS